MCEIFVGCSESWGEESGDSAVVSGVLWYLGRSRQPGAADHRDGWKRKAERETKVIEVTTKTKRVSFNDLVMASLFL